MRCTTTSAANKICSRSSYIGGKTAPSIRRQRNDAGAWNQSVPKTDPVGAGDAFLACAGMCPSLRKNLSANHGIRKLQCGLERQNATGDRASDMRRNAGIGEKSDYRYNPTLAIDPDRRSSPRYGNRNHQFQHPCPVLSVDRNHRP